MRGCLEGYHQAKGDLIRKAHTVANNIRQGIDWDWITGVLSNNNKAERRRKAFFIGHDPVREKMRHPTMVVWTKKLRTRRKWKMILLDMRD